eukprot:scaffold315959_cov39-Tisochrysis_lutea.AAC.1
MCWSSTLASVRNHSTTAACPPAYACSSGVKPCLSRMSTELESVRSHWTAARWPPALARCKALLPPASSASVAAPAARSARSRLVSPCRAASRKLSARRRLHCESPDH